MYLLASARIAREHPGLAPVVARIDQAVRDAGRDPVIRPAPIASFLGVDRQTVEQALTLYVEAGALELRLEVVCEACGSPLDPAVIAGAIDGLTCPECGARAAPIESRAFVLRAGVAAETPVIADPDRARVALVTALPIEAAAVRAVLGAHGVVARGRDRPRAYDVAAVRGLGGARHPVLHLCLGDMGTNAASTRAAVLFEHFPAVELVCMVGIAGGVPAPHDPEVHVRLGDVVVSDRKGVIQYDFVRQETDDVRYRYPPRPPAAALAEAVTRVRTDAESGIERWQELVRAHAQDRFARPPARADVLVDQAGARLKHPRDKRRVAGAPRVFYGPIASSNTVLRDPRIRDRLRDRLEVRAVEMESAGVAEAAWQAERGYLVVRGISDYCDARKNDAWHPYAALVAAAYAVGLLAEWPGRL